MTIAQQLNIKDFPFEIKDSKGKTIYRETSDGYWAKCEYDSKGNLIYYEESDGYWYKREYDSQGNTIYYKDSDGILVDNRHKTELTLDEIAQKFGIPVSQLKIKK